MDPEDLEFGSGLSKELIDKYPVIQADVEKRVGEQIIGNLNSDGYIMANPEEIASLEDVDPAFAEDVLEKLQKFMDLKSVI